MARLLTLTCTLLVCSALSAQADEREPAVVEMKIERSLDAESNGVADLLDQVQADRLILYYSLQNPGEDLNIAPEIRIAHEVNCAAVVTQRPDEQVAAGGSTLMVIEVTPKESGPVSFTVNMIVNDAAYAFPVQSTVTAVLHSDEYYHCHDGDCHWHEEEHHHCSTGESSNWLMLGGVTAALAAVMLRRRAP